MRAGHVALATVEDRFHERVAARHNIADHPQIGRDRDLFLAETFGELDAQRHHLVAHRRIDVGVAAGDAVTGLPCESGHPAHERAADTEDMDVHGRDSRSRFSCRPRKRHPYWREGGLHR